MDGDYSRNTSGRPSFLLIAPSDLISFLTIRKLYVRGLPFKLAPLTGKLMDNGGLCLTLVFSPHTLLRLVDIEAPMLIKGVCEPFFRTFELPSSPQHTIDILLVFLSQPTIDQHLNSTIAKSRFLCCVHQIIRITAPPPSLGI